MLLFSRIQEQVKEGRWKIVGGWFLQPDCNIPSGEAIYRQVLKGRLYFFDKFGEVPVTVTNFDSFGHAQGLVQMLEQCGYKHYVNIRPGKNNYDFDSEDFIWKGYDGASELIVHRSDKGYNSVLGKVHDELPGWMDARKDHENALYLWGVGNHGGGPSRKDLDDIAAMKANGADICHSTPDVYFATLDKTSLPTVDRGLNIIMEGCYTSIVRIKQLHRKLENDLIMAEKMASHAALAGLSTYEKQQLDDAWRDLLFAEFHDALPGSCIEPVEEDTLRILNHGLEITNRLKAKYFLALSAGQEKLKDGNTIPLLVYNPHPFTYDQPIDVEFTLPKQMWHTDFSDPVVTYNGKPVPCQSAKESGNFNMDWCKRVIFDCPLAPCSMNRFDIYFNTISKRPEPSLVPDQGNILVKTNKGHVKINTETGLVDSYQIDGKEFVNPGAFSVQVFADAYNSWSGGAVLKLDSPQGCFHLMTPVQATDYAGVKSGIVQPVRVVEEGAVLTAVEADMMYHDSRMVMTYLIHKQTGILELKIRLFNAEKEKRMKLMITTTLTASEHWGQTIFGREKPLYPKTGMPQEGDVLTQYWQALADDSHGFTIIDDGVYGSYCKDGCLGVTLLRSAGYGASRFTWGDPFQETLFQPRMDQGERCYRFRISAGTREQQLLAADRSAAIFNQKAYAMAFCPSGRGTKPKQLLTVDQQNITVSCLKQSERDGEAFILRLYEAQGMKTIANVTLPILGLTKSIAFNPFEIKTFRIKEGLLTETDILEGAVPIKQ